MAEEVDDGETWAVVELMGHVKLAGRLSEVERFGSKMGRLDIPAGDGFVTQFFGGGSVYRITVVAEDVARHIAARGSSPAPVQPWEFPKRLAPAVGTGDTDPDDDRDETDSDLEPF